MPQHVPMRLPILIAVLLSLPFRSIGAQTAPASKPPPQKPALFLQVRDQQLFLGQLPFRNVGANIPDLFERFLRGDDAGATQALSDARAAGVRCVRFAGMPRAANTARTFATDQARWLNAWDRMLTAANSHELALIPSLLYDVRTLSEVAAGTSGTVNAADSLDADTPANRLAVAYVTAIVTRYRNDPRILFWEIGNEINLLAARNSTDAAPSPSTLSISDRVRAFLSQMASLIHRLDKRHPVTSGNGDLPTDAAHLPHHWPDKRYPSVTSS